MTTALRVSVPVATTTDALDRACLCARVAADNKARDVVVLDMRGVTQIYDFLVLTTGAAVVVALTTASCAGVDGSQAEGPSAAGVSLEHMDINIFTQIGFVVLVGLASKKELTKEIEDQLKAVLAEFKTKAWK